jgi:hypothetical protein
MSKHSLEDKTPTKPAQPNTKITFLRHSTGHPAAKIKNKMHFLQKSTILPILLTIMKPDCGTVDH